MHTNTRTRTPTRKRAHTEKNQKYKKTKKNACVYMHTLAHAFVHIVDLDERRDDAGASPEEELDESDLRNTPSRGMTSLC